MFKSTKLRTQEQPVPLLIANKPKEEEELDVLVEHMDESDSVYALPLSTPAFLPSLFFSFFFFFFIFFLFFFFFSLFPLSFILN